MPVKAHQIHAKFSGSSPLPIPPTNSYPSKLSMLRLNNLNDKKLIF